MQRPLHDLLDRRPAPDVERDRAAREHRVGEGVHPRVERRRHQPDLPERRVELAPDPRRVGELAVGLVVRAFGGREVTQERVENDDAFVMHVPENGGVGVGGIEGGGVREEALFESLDAGDAPAGADHLFDEEQFVRGGGQEFVEILSS